MIDPNVITLGGGLSKAFNCFKSSMLTSIKENSPTFNIENIHSYDLTKVLDEMGIAIRSGHHCAQPLMNALGISSSNRMSLSFYNTEEEINRFISLINKSIKILI